VLPVGLADMLQWAFLVDGPERAVVLNKDGALLAAWRYTGPDTATASGPALDAIARQVNDALLPFADGWMWHVDAVRRPAEPYPASAFLGLRADAPEVSVPAWIDAERRAAVAGPARDAATRRATDAPAGQFVSEYTLTLTYLPPAAAHARAAGLFVSGGVAGQGTGAAAVFDAALAHFQRHAALLEQRLGGRFHLARLGAEALVSHLHRCLTALDQPGRAAARGGLPQRGPREPGVRARLRAPRRRTPPACHGRRGLPRRPRRRAAGLPARARGPVPLVIALHPRRAAGR
jgi:type IV secretion system protein VirB4